MHAIKAGEGDVFISGGRRDGQPLRQGQQRCLPDTKNPLFADAEASGRGAGQGRLAAGHDPREAGAVPDIYIAMGQTAENVAQVKGISRAGAGRVRRPVAEPGREGHRQRLLGARDHADHAARRHASSRRRRPARRRDAREGVGAQAGLPARRHRHGRQLLPAERRRRSRHRDERHEGRRAGHHAAGPDRHHRRERAVARDHGPRPGRGLAAGARAGPA